MIKPKSCKPIVMLILALSLFSCKKFVEIPPPLTQIAGSDVYSSDVTATSAVIGIYSQMINTYPDFANGGITLYAGLSADEFKNYILSGSQPEFYSNALTSTNVYIKTLWSSAYNYIYSANAILEGLEKSVGVTAGTKKQLQGEVTFIRAFCHFYLTNLFGDVPYIVTTDYRVTSVAPRIPRSEVYQKIINDLLDAQNMLSVTYSYSNGERVRPNKWAATALLSRVYLYLGDWIKAETQASTVINNTSLFSLVNNLNNVFLKNSVESIWQLMPAQGTINTQEGNRFILTSAPTSTDLSAQVFNAFELGDQRAVLGNWVQRITVGANNYYFPYKYKVKTGSTLTEYYMVLRLAELYLIRAEARAQQNNISGSQADLNIIRTRAGLSNTTATDKPSLLLAVEHERQVELFAEWGHRWLDLKRTNRATTILGPLKTGWQLTDELYPIPLSQLQNDPNMSQNPGY